MKILDVHSSLGPHHFCDAEMMSASTPVEESKPPSVSRSTPTVFVIDDDVSVRESIELLIRSVGWEPQLFASGQAFFSRPRAFTPSCLILDVSLPGLNGLGLQKRISGTRTDMPIIVITRHADVRMTVEAMKAGAVEFLTKPFCDAMLLDAIRHAIEISRTVLSQEAKVREIRDNYAKLSRRERQVMELVVLGRLNKQVGGDLGISEVTVKAHRGRAMQKMNAASLADLVNKARLLPHLALSG